MISTYFFYFIAFHLLHYSHSLQSGYTCQSTVNLTCPKSRTIVILEVTYSSECNAETNETSIYAPSRCIGYYRERTSNQCNGKESCIVDNSPEQRPSFMTGKQANCIFKGHSVNIEYSCIPDFYAKELPSIDICSTKILDDVKEGFIHSPNYPNDYPNNMACTKIIPAPEIKNRLKIYVLDFDVEGVRVIRLTRLTQVNDWLEINENGEKFYGTRSPYTLLFDDVIEASLKFQSDSTNSKRVYHGFLLYFIVTPIRRSRPKTTTTTPDLVIISEDDSIEPKTAALFIEKQPKTKSNIGLILLVILLSTILVMMVCAFLLYKRRNDRRMRYLTQTFPSVGSQPSKSMITDSSENSSKMKSEPSSLIIQDEHIYSQDPMDENALLYERIDYETIDQKMKSNKNIV